eukprot:TRINITY_DN3203_c0_g1_i2.p1 TRINITY_DN3203_c0_g1~~TRINITY_DN3203_c0_g1_i2.p1  ORF type:complete len:184 (+),score=41.58 TRINITY_DN3203_c0_g1_i2:419-970(+)
MGQLKTDLTGKIEEISSLRQTLVVNMPAQTQIEYQRQLFALQDSKTKAETEQRRLEARATEIVTQLNNLTKEIDKLYELSEQRRLERDDAVKQVENLKIALIESKVADSLIDKVKYLSKEVDELSVNRDFFKQQAERNAQELNDKNRQLVEKLEQLDQIKQSQQESLAHIQHLENQLSEKFQQ